MARNNGRRSIKEEDIIFRNWTKLAYLEDGVIVIRNLSYSDWSLRSPTPWFEPLAKLAEKHGYRSFSEQSALRYLAHNAGKTLADLEQEMEARSVQLAKMREDRKKDSQNWKKLQAAFDGYILGIDDIDIYETGMSICVLLNSTKTFEEQRAFVRQYRKDIFAYVKEEMPRTKRVSKSLRQKGIDLLPFCKTSEAILTRRNLLIYKLDLKDEVCAVLKEEDND